MKKTDLYQVISVLVLMAIATDDIFSQARWMPVTIDINIPAITEYRTYSSSAPDVITSGYGSIGCPIAIDFKTRLDSFSQKSGIIDMTFTECDNCSPTLHIHFVIDTISQRLNNFVYNYSYAHADKIDPSQYRSHGHSDDFVFKFSVLDFVVSGDSLMVSSNDKICMEQLDTAYFDVSDASSYSPPRDQHTYQGYEWHSTKLLGDTTAYRCKLVFLLERSDDVVLQQRISQPQIELHISLPDHAIRFSFPTSDHPQQMTVFDILGREVSRIEIPAGNSSYQMASVGYPNGTYFARLGSQTASFIVN